MTTRMHYIVCIALAHFILREKQITIIKIPQMRKKWLVSYIKFIVSEIKFWNRATLKQFLVSKEYWRPDQKSICHNQKRRSPETQQGLNNKYTFHPHNTQVFHSRPCGLHTSVLASMWVWVRENLGVTGKKFVSKELL